MSLMATLYWKNRKSVSINYRNILPVLYIEFIVKRKYSSMQKKGSFSSACFLFKYIYIYYFERAFFQGGLLCVLLYVYHSLCVCVYTTLRCFDFAKRAFERNCRLHVCHSNWGYDSASTEAMQFSLGLLQRGYAFCAQKKSVFWKRISL